MSTQELRHIRRTTPSSALILVLDTGAVINAEAEAMLQALQSRSNKGVEEHLKIVEERGAEKFMETYYVRYGHKSIADCGSQTIFVEECTMLIAKAVQDWFDYCGQEGSTRFMDFSLQPFRNPLGTPQGMGILENWRRFYVSAMPAVAEHLKAQYPLNEGEKSADYEKAIAARAFDILRAFLPAGATTKFSWHTNLRQAADHIARLRHHPLSEVREIAEAMEDALREKYPSSFSHKRYPETEAYNAAWMRNYYYFRFLNDPGFSVNSDNVNKERLDLYEVVIDDRPSSKTEIPKELASCGTVEFGFMLDFASFRDLQRHRAVHQRMPLLGLDGGFEGWYLNQLPDDLHDEAVLLLERQETLIDALDVSDEERQYYIAMGYRVQCEVIGTLPAVTYLAELRATRFVHPTLRRRAQQMADYLSKELDIKIHLDPDPDRFDVKRGTHDIVEKV